jgi:hypothetical protein
MATTFATDQKYSQGESYVYVVNPTVNSVTSESQFGFGAHGVEHERSFVGTITTDHILGVFGPYPVPDHGHVHYYDLAQIPLTPLN